MKLYYTSASPYVRKVVVTAIEAGIDGEIERVTPATSVWVGEGDPEVANDNPLGKVPTLITREGSTLIDSTLICEYLASLVPEAGLLPVDGEERWHILNFQALAQGMMDAMVFRLLETQVRPDEYSWPGWAERQGVKVSRSMDVFEKMAANGEFGPVNLGAITLGSALGYQEQRQNDTSWKTGRPTLAGWYDEFSQRESMLATIPPELPPPHLDPRRG